MNNKQRLLYSCSTLVYSYFEFRIGSPFMLQMIFNWITSVNTFLKNNVWLLRLELQQRLNDGKHVIKKKKNELIKFSRALALHLARTLYLCRKFEMSESADWEFGVTNRRLMYAYLRAYMYFCVCVWATSLASVFVNLDVSFFFLFLLLFHCTIYHWQWQSRSLSLPLAATILVFGE